MTLDSAIGVLVAALFSAFLSFQAAKQAVQHGKKVAAMLLPAFIGLAAFAVLKGLGGAWPSAVGWVAFLAGFVEAVAASNKLPEFEVLPLVTDDPTAASWPNLFCLQCYIQTKAKRTFPPEPLTAAGVTGELARLVTDHDSPQVARRYVHAEVESLRAALKTTRQRKAVATPAP